jgi:hypothetical protein
MEKTSDNCDNFLKPNCDPRIKENYMFQEKKPGQPVSYIDTRDETIQKEAAICLKCKYFKPRKPQ